MGAASLIFCPGAAARALLIGTPWVARCCEGRIEPAQEAGKIAGGNYMRIFRAAVG